MITPTQQSLDLIRHISEQISDQTFHHHYHVLYDIPLPENSVYLEIGCYAGGSACLMLQKPNIKVISVDLGEPIDESVVKNNVSKLNKLSNEFHYIKADSHLHSTVELVKNVVDEVDLLFIDGDHSFGGVVCDFNLWNPLVKSGGYLVFDDYHDYMYSPEVKIAVDSMLNTFTGWEILGTCKNVLGARPADMREGNCFIMRKK